MTQAAKTVLCGNCGAETSRARFCSPACKSSFKIKSREAYSRNVARRAVLSDEILTVSTEIDSYPPPWERKILAAKLLALQQELDRVCEELREK